MTDRRILNVDKQGMTGAKKNYDSIALNRVGRFAVEFVAVLLRCPPCGAAARLLDS